MSTIKRTLVLTGGRAGQTVLLAKMYQFTDGKITLKGSSPNVESLTHWMAVNYAAYPEGSLELEAANGKRDLPADAKPNEEHPVLGGDQQGGEGTPPEAAGIGSQPDGTDTGAPDGRVPDGDGHKDARVDRIKEALNRLDMADDSQWTTTGEPAMSVVEAFLGEKITRAELKAVVPDFNREG